MQIGFLGLLALIFITLKLLGIIAWSWLWVTAPIWGGAALWLVFILVITVVASIIAVTTKKTYPTYRRSRF